jgi:hypothetical protein
MAPIQLRVVAPLGLLLGVSCTGPQHPPPSPGRPDVPPPTCGQWSVAANRDVHGVEVNDFTRTPFNTVQLYEACARALALPGNVYNSSLSLSDVQTLTDARTRDFCESMSSEQATSVAAGLNILIPGLDLPLGLSGSYDTTSASRRQACDHLRTYLQQNRDVQLRQNLLVVTANNESYQTCIRSITPQLVELQPREGEISYRVSRPTLNRQESASIVFAWRPASGQSYTPYIRGFEWTASTLDCCPGIPHAGQPLAARSPVIVTCRRTACGIASVTLRTHTSGDVTVQLPDCGSCGGHDEVRCPDPFPPCQAGLTLDGSNRCHQCGRSGAVCCPGRACDAPGVCLANSTCGPCGTIGRACCAGNACNGGLECLESLCRQCRTVPRPGTTTFVRTVSLEAHDVHGFRDVTIPDAQAGDVIRIVRSSGRVCFDGDAECGEAETGHGDDDDENCGVGDGHAYHRLAIDVPGRRGFARDLRNYRWTNRSNAIAMCFADGDDVSDNNGTYSVELEITRAITTQERVCTP